jgi:hypothetical protein
MFQIAVSLPFRKMLLAGAASLTLIVGGAGGAVWHFFLRCDARDYFDRAAVSSANPSEQYLFACGYVWRSLDGGRVWWRMDPSGLPWGTRHGRIAVDLEPSTLYLGIQIATASSLQCWNCAWAYLRPAIYVSTDGGRSWTFAYKFRRGPAESNDFLKLAAQPDRQGAVWAVIKNSDEISYWGSATLGRSWKRACVEYYFPSGANCELLPKSVRQALFPSSARHQFGGE